MEIAIVVATLGRAENRELDVIAAARFINRMQRLMKITHKMDEPLKRFQPVGPGSFFIAKNFLKHLNPIHHAVVMVSRSILMFILRAETVALFRETSSIFWNIDKVPIVAFVALFSDGIGPACNGSQRVSAEKKLEILFGGRRK